jgi:hypothetical protein
MDFGVGTALSHIDRMPELVHPYRSTDLRIPLSILEKRSTATTTMPTKM